jgi:hypothetical protein
MTLTRIENMNKGYFYTTNNDMGRTRSQPRNDNFTDFDNTLDIEDVVFQRVTERKRRPGLDPNWRCMIGRGALPAKLLEDTRKGQRRRGVSG